MGACTTWCEPGGIDFFPRLRCPHISLTMSAVELQLDIDEFEALLEASERPNVKAVLEKEKARLEAQIKALESKAERASAEGVSDVSALLLSFSCSLSLPLTPH